MTQPATEAVFGHVKFIYFGVSLQEITKALQEDEDGSLNVGVEPDYVLVQTEESI